MNDAIHTQSKTGADQADQGRREAMFRMAKYTAPLMLAALVSEKAMAVSGGGGGHPSPWNCFGGKGPSYLLLTERDPDADIVDPRYTVCDRRRPAASKQGDELPVRL